MQSLVISKIKSNVYFTYSLLPQGLSAITSCKVNHNASVKQVVCLDTFPSHSEILQAKDCLLIGT